MFARNLCTALVFLITATCGFSGTAIAQPKVDPRHSDRSPSHAAEGVASTATPHEGEAPRTIVHVTNDATAAQILCAINWNAQSFVHAMTALEAPKLSRKKARDLVEGLLGHDDEKLQEELKKILGADDAWLAHDLNALERGKLNGVLLAAYRAFFDKMKVKSPEAEDKASAEAALLLDRATGDRTLKHLGARVVDGGRGKIPPAILTALGKLDTISDEDREGVRRWAMGKLDEGALGPLAALLVTALDDHGYVENDRVSTEVRGTNARYRASCSATLLREERDETGVTNAVIEKEYRRFLEFNEEMKRDPAHAADVRNITREQFVAELRKRYDAQVSTLVRGLEKDLGRGVPSVVRTRIAQGYRGLDHLPSFHAEMPKNPSQVWGSPSRATGPVETYAQDEFENIGTKYSNSTREKPSSAVIWIMANPQWRQAAAANLQACEAGGAAGKCEGATARPDAKRDTSTKKDSAAPPIGAAPGKPAPADPSQAPACTLNGLAQRLVAALHLAETAKSQAEIYETLSGDPLAGGKAGPGLEMVFGTNARLRLLAPVTPEKKEKLRAHLIQNFNENWKSLAVPAAVAAATWETRLAADLAAGDAGVAGFREKFAALAHAVSPQVEIPSEISDALGKFDKLTPAESTELRKWAEDRDRLAHPEFRELAATLLHLTDKKFPRADKAAALLAALKVRTTPPPGCEAVPGAEHAGVLTPQPAGRAIDGLAVKPRVPARKDTHFTKLGYQAISADVEKLAQTMDSNLGRLQQILWIAESDDDGREIAHATDEYLRARTGKTYFEHPAAERKRIATKTAIDEYLALVDEAAARFGYDKLPTQALLYADFAANPHGRLPLFTASIDARLKAHGIALPLDTLGDGETARTKLRDLAALHALNNGVGHDIELLRFALGRHGKDLTEKGARPPSRDRQLLGKDFFHYPSFDGVQAWSQICPKPAALTLDEAVKKAGRPAGFAFPPISPLAGPRERLDGVERCKNEVYAVARALEKTPGEEAKKKIVETRLLKDYAVCYESALAGRDPEEALLYSADSLLLLDRAMRSDGKKGHHHFLAKAIAVIRKVIADSTGGVPPANRDKLAIDFLEKAYFGKAELTAKSLLPYREELANLCNDARKGMASVQTAVPRQASDVCLLLQAMDAEGVLTGEPGKSAFLFNVADNRKFIPACVREVPESAPAAATTARIEGTTLRSDAKPRFTVPTLTWYSGKSYLDDLAGRTDGGPRPERGLPWLRLPEKGDANDIIATLEANGRFLQRTSFTAYNEKKDGGPELRSIEDYYRAESLGPWPVTSQRDFATRLMNHLLEKYRAQWKDARVRIEKMEPKARAGYALMTSADTLGLLLFSGAVPNPLELLEHRFLHILNTLEGESEELAEQVKDAFRAKWRDGVPALFRRIADAKNDAAGRAALRDARRWILENYAKLRAVEQAIAKRKDPKPTERELRGASAVRDLSRMLSLLARHIDMVGRPEEMRHAFDLGSTTAADDATFVLIEETRALEKASAKTHAAIAAAEALFEAEGAILPAEARLLLTRDEQPTRLFAELLPAMARHDRAGAARLLYSRDAWARDWAWGDLSEAHVHFANFRLPSAHLGQRLISLDRARAAKALAILEGGKLTRADVARIYDDYYRDRMGYSLSDEWKEIGVRAPDEPASKDDMATLLARLTEDALGLSHLLRPEPIGKKVDVTGNFHDRFHRRQALESAHRRDLVRALETFNPADRKNFDGIVQSILYREVPPVDPKELKESLQVGALLKAVHDHGKADAPADLDPQLKEWVARLARGYATVEGQVGVAGLREANLEAMKKAIDFLRLRAALSPTDHREEKLARWLHLRNDELNRVFRLSNLQLGPHDGETRESKGQQRQSGLAVADETFQLRRLLKLPEPPAPKAEKSRVIAFVPGGGYPATLRAYLDEARKASPQRALELIGEPVSLMVSKATQTRCPRVFWDVRDKKQVARWIIDEWKKDKFLGGLRVPEIPADLPDDVIIYPPNMTPQEYRQRYCRQTGGVETPNVFDLAEIREKLMRYLESLRYGTEAAGETLEALATAALVRRLDAMAAPQSEELRVAMPDDARAYLKILDREIGLSRIEAKSAFERTGKAIAFYDKDVANNARFVEKVSGFARIALDRDLPATSRVALMELPLAARIALLRDLEVRGDKIVDGARNLRDLERKLTTLQDQATAMDIEKTAYGVTVPDRPDYAAEIAKHREQIAAAKAALAGQALPLASHLFHPSAGAVMADALSDPTRHDDLTQTLTRAGSLLSATSHESKFHWQIRAAEDKFRDLAKLTPIQREALRQDLKDLLVALAAEGRVADPDVEKILAGEPLSFGYAFEAERVTGFLLALDHDGHQARFREDPVFRQAAAAGKLGKIPTSPLDMLRAVYAENRAYHRAGCAERPTPPACERLRKLVASGPGTPAWARTKILDPALTPHHFEQLDRLMALVPALPHGDRQKSAQRALDMLRMNPDVAAIEATSRELDPHFHAYVSGKAQAPYWSEKLEKMLTAATERTAACKPGKLADVDFGAQKAEFETVLDRVAELEALSEIFRATQALPDVKPPSDADIEKRKNELAPKHRASVAEALRAKVAQALIEKEIAKKGAQAAATLAAATPDTALGCRLRSLLSPIYAEDATYWTAKRAELTDQILATKARDIDAHPDLRDSKRGTPEYAERRAAVVAAYRDSKDFAAQFARAMADHRASDAFHDRVESQFQEKVAHRAATGAATLGDTGRAARLQTWLRDHLHECTTELARRQAEGKPRDASVVLRLMAQEKRETDGAKRDEARAVKLDAEAKKLAAEGKDAEAAAKRAAAQQARFAAAGAQALALEAKLQLAQKAPPRLESDPSETLKQAADSLDAETDAAERHIKGFVAQRTQLILARERADLEVTTVESLEKTLGERLEALKKLPSKPPTVVTMIERSEAALKKHRADLDALRVTAARAFARVSAYDECETDTSTAQKNAVDRLVRAMTDRLAKDGADRRFAPLPKPEFLKELAAVAEKEMAPVAAKLAPEGAPPDFLAELARLKGDACLNHAMLKVFHARTARLEPELQTEALADMAKKRESFDRQYSNWAEECLHVLRGKGVEFPFAKTADQEWFVEPADIAIVADAMLKLQGATHRAEAYFRGVVPPPGTDALLLPPDAEPAVATWYRAGCPDEARPAEAPKKLLSLVARAHGASFDELKRSLTQGDGVPYRLGAESADHLFEKMLVDACRERRRDDGELRAVLAELAPYGYRWNGRELTYDRGALWEVAAWDKLQRQISAIAGMKLDGKRVRVTEPAAAKLKKLGYVWDETKQELTGGPAASDCVGDAIGYALKSYLRLAKYETNVRNLPALEKAMAKLGKYGRYRDGGTTPWGETLAALEENYQRSAFEKNFGVAELGTAVRVTTRDGKDFRTDKKHAADYLELDDLACVKKNAQAKADELQRAVLALDLLEKKCRAESNSILVSPFGAKLENASDRKMWGVVPGTQGVGQGLHDAYDRYRDEIGKIRKLSGELGEFGNIGVTPKPAIGDAAKEVGAADQAGFMLTQAAHLFEPAHTQLADELMDNVMAGREYLAEWVAIELATRGLARAAKVGKVAEASRLARYAGGTARFVLPSAEGVRLAYRANFATKLIMEGWANTFAPKDYRQTMNWSTVLEGTHKQAIVFGTAPLVNAGAARLGIPEVIYGPAGLGLITLGVEGMYGSSWGEASRHALQTSAFGLPFNQWMGRIASSSSYLRFRPRLQANLAMGGSYATFAGLGLGLAYLHYREQGKYVDPLGNEIKGDPAKGIMDNVAFRLATDSILQGLPLDAHFALRARGEVQAYAAMYTMLRSAKMTPSHLASLYAENLRGDKAHERAMEIVTEAMHLTPVGQLRALRAELDDPKTSKSDEARLRQTLAEYAQSLGLVPAGADHAHSLQLLDRYLKSATGGAQSQYALRDVAAEIRRLARHDLMVEYRAGQVADPVLAGKKTGEPFRLADLLDHPLFYRDGKFDAESFHLIPLAEVQAALRAPETAPATAVKLAVLALQAGAFYGVTPARRAGFVDYVGAHAGEPGMTLGGLADRYNRVFRLSMGEVAGVLGRAAGDPAKPETKQARLELAALAREAGLTPEAYARAHAKHGENSAEGTLAGLGRILLRPFGVGPAPRNRAASGEQAAIRLAAANEYKKSVADAAPGEAKEKALDAMLENPFFAEPDGQAHVPLLELNPTRDAHLRWLKDRAVESDVGPTIFRRWLRTAETREFLQQKYGRDATVEHALAEFKLLPIHAPNAMKRQLTKEGRAEAAKEILGREPTEPELKAVEDAHEVGKGELGNDGKPAGYGTYTSAQLRRKREILKKAKIHDDKIERFIREGVVGETSELAKAAEREKQATFIIKQFMKADASESHLQALEAAYAVGKGENGPNGQPASSGNYTPAQRQRKIDILSKAGYSETAILHLLNHGIITETPAGWAHGKVEHVLEGELSPLDRVPGIRWSGEFSVVEIGGEKMIIGLGGVKFKGGLHVAAQTERFIEANKIARARAIERATREKNSATLKAVEDHFAWLDGVVVRTLSNGVIQYELPREAFAKGGYGSTEEAVKQKTFPGYVAGGKSQFPKSWTSADIMAAAAHVMANGDKINSPTDGSYTYWKQGEYKGVKVVVADGRYDAGNIATVFPAWQQ